jgi:hypothetical protein
MGNLFPTLEPMMPMMPMMPMIQTVLRWATIPEVPNLPKCMLDEFFHFLDDGGNLTTQWKITLGRWRFCGNGGRASKTSCQHILGYDGSSKMMTVLPNILEEWTLGVCIYVYTYTHVVYWSDLTGWLFVGVSTHYTWYVLNLGYGIGCVWCVLCMLWFRFLELLICLSTPFCSSTLSKIQSTWIVQAFAQSKWKITWKIQKLKIPSFLGSQLRTWKIRHFFERLDPWV